MRRAKRTASAGTQPAAIADGTFDDPEGQGDDEGLDAEFEFGLERILDGVEVLMQRRSLRERPDPSGAGP